MAAQFNAEYELTRGSIRIAQLVGEPQAQVEAEWTGPFLQRSQSNEVKIPQRPIEKMKLHRSSSYNNLRSKERAAYGSSPKTPKLKLPSFDELGISSLCVRNEPSLNSGKDIRSCQQPQDYFQRSPTRSQTSTGPSLPYFFGSTPLLTPPEDSDSVKWNRAVARGNLSQLKGASITQRLPSLFTIPLTSQTQSSRDSSSPPRPSNSENDAPSLTSTGRPPPYPEINESGDDWLEKAIRRTGRT